MDAEKRCEVVVLGGANTDFLIRGERFPKPGETADGEEFLQAPGGKGANQAVAASRLGARTAFIGKMGNDERGDELVAGLRKEGVDTRHVVRGRRQQTGAALIMVDNTGEKQILTAPGANQKLTIGEMTKAAPLLRGCRVLLVQFETPIAVVLRATQLASRAGAIVVLDPAPPQTKHEDEGRGRARIKQLLSCVDVVRPNFSEAEALTGVRVTNRESAMRAAQRLFKAGVRSAVAIQAGEEGDLLIARDRPRGPIVLPRMKVKTVDATGAGDAFAAALAVAVAWRQPLTIAAPFASAAAALATTKFGAQPAMPYLRDVIGLMRRNGFARQAGAISTRG